MKEKLKELALKAQGHREKAMTLLDTIKDDATPEERATIMKSVRSEREAAEAVADQIKELKALDGVKGVLDEPARPPFGDGSDEPSSNGDDPDNKPPSPNGDGPSNFAKSFFTHRYGNASAAVKSILYDLHGNDYEQELWDQRIAFNTYLRRGEKALTKDQENLLQTRLLLTPDVVEQYIIQGLDVQAMRSTLVEAIDTLGGYLVPTDFNTDVIKRLMGLTVMRGRARVATTSRDAAEWPKLTGGDSQYTGAVRVTWVDETPAAGASETNPTFGMEKVPVETVMATTAMSRNNLEDSAFNLAQILAELLAEAAAIDEDNRFLIGHGAGTPQGILPGGSNTLGLTEVTTGHASLLNDWDTLISLSYALDRQYRNNAKWFAEKATYEEIAKLKMGTGEYYWNPDQRDDEVQRLRGFETLEQEALPSIAAASYPMIFGDPKGYLIVDRIGMSIERYLGGTEAEQNIVKYVMRRRLGGQVVEPWRFAVMKVSA